MNREMCGVEEKMKWERKKKEGEKKRQAATGSQALLNCLCVRSCPDLAANHR